MTWVTVHVSPNLEFSASALLATYPLRCSVLTPPRTFPIEKVGALFLGCSLPQLASRLGGLFPFLEGRGPVPVPLQPEFSQYRDLRALPQLRQTDIITREGGAPFFNYASRSTPILVS